MLKDQSRSMIHIFVANGATESVVRGLVLHIGNRTSIRHLSAGTFEFDGFDRVRRRMPTGTLSLKLINCNS